MQTDELLRSNGSIKARDVALYLHSRFGLDIDEATVNMLIVKELAGNVSTVKWVNR